MSVTKTWKLGGSFRVRRIFYYQTEKHFQQERAINVVRVLMLNCFVVQATAISLVFQIWQQNCERLAKNDANNKLFKH